MSDNENYSNSDYFKEHYDIAVNETTPSHSKGKDHYRAPSAPEKKPNGGKKDNNRLKLLIICAFIVVAAVAAGIGIAQANNSTQPVAATEESTSVQAEAVTECPTAAPLDTTVAGISDAQKEKLKELVEEKLDSSNFSGSVVIGAGNGVLVNVQRGYSNIEKKENNTENTKYEIGSMTKQFTAAAIMKLAQEGKLSINDKVSKYFKDSHFNDKLTVENLLTMTSGVPDYLNDNIFAVETGDRKEDSKYTKDEFTKWLNTRESAFDPGDSFYYSNTNYYMLGLIIEQVTGESYEDYMTEQILIPNQLYNTSMSMADATANGYLTTDGDKGIKIDSSYFYSAGEMVSTAPDIFRWLCAFDTGAVTGNDLLKKATSIDKFGYNYGYGWFIDYLGDYYYHTGNTELFYGVDVVSFNDDIKVVALSNINDTTVQQLGIELLNLTERELYPGKHDTTEPSEEATEKPTDKPNN